MSICLRGATARAAGSAGSASSGRGSFGILCHVICCYVLMFMLEDLFRNMRLGDRGGIGVGSLENGVEMAADPLGVGRLDK